MSNSRNPNIIDDESRLQIERSIWGATSTSGMTGSAMLDNYFQYCQREMRQAAVLVNQRAEHFSSILSAFDVLKSNCNKPKQELVALHPNPSVMDLSLRLMLMTGCRASGTIGGDIFRPWWTDQESLVQYINRVYPQYDMPAEGRGVQSLLALHKLGADYLRSHANINIMWTDHLTDHLVLLQGSNWKSLYVFAHPAFIFKSLQTLSGVGFKNGTEQNEAGAAYVDPCAEALSHGCLPSALLHETLLTLEILFPPVGDVGSQRFLAKEVERRGLDPMLLKPLRFDSSDHERPSDALRPTDLGGLYQRFPFWASRLQDLWAEADDPTPVSYIGKLTDRKKSPRFMYTCGILALSVAILFGVVGTILAALQVWISYCSWMDDPNVRGCSLKGHTGGGSR